VTWYNLSFESYGTSYLEGQEVAWSRGYLFQFWCGALPPVCTVSLVQRFSRIRKHVTDPKIEKNIFNFKLEQFVAYILFLINGTDTSRFGSLLILLKRHSKKYMMFILKELDWTSILTKKKPSQKAGTFSLPLKRTQLRKCNIMVTCPFVLNCIRF
jgi:hypothetical protein